MTPEILQQRDELIATRQTADTYRELVAPINKEMENEISLIRLKYYEQNSELFDNLSAAESALDHADQTLRETLCKAYATFGEKQIAEGLSVRVNTKLEYKPKEALEWAKKHELCLTLDKTAFEKVAKVQDLDFVTVIEVPTAVIAKELTNGDNEARAAF